MNKPLILYTALTKAVDHYNERNNLTRGHLADAIGFVGENAATQLSNALNPMNHDKTLNDEKKCKLLHTIEYEDLLVYFTHYMKQFGLRPVSIQRPGASTTSMHDAIDDAMISGDEVFKFTKVSLKNKTLTAYELAAIISESKLTEELYANVRHIAEERLRLMEVK